MPKTRQAKTPQISKKAKRAGWKGRTVDRLKYDLRHPFRAIRRPLWQYKRKLPIGETIQYEDVRSGNHRGRLEVGEIAQTNISIPYSKSSLETKSGTYFCDSLQGVLGVQEKKGFLVTHVLEDFERFEPLKAPFHLPEEARFTDRVARRQADFLAIKIRAPRKRKKA